jgi:hypothetical protein
VQDCGYRPSSDQSKHAVIALADASRLSRVIGETN